MKPAAYIRGLLGAMAIASSSVLVQAGDDANKHQYAQTRSPGITLKDEGDYAVSVNGIRLIHPAAPSFEGYCNPLRLGIMRENYSKILSLLDQRIASASGTGRVVELKRKGDTLLEIVVCAGQKPNEMSIPKAIDQVQSLYENVVQGLACNENEMRNLYELPIDFAVRIGALEGLVGIYMGKMNRLNVSSSEAEQYHIRAQDAVDTISTCHPPSKENIQKQMRDIRRFLKDPNRKQLPLTQEIKPA